MIKQKCVYDFKFFPSPNRPRQVVNRTKHLKKLRSLWDTLFNKKESVWPFYLVFYIFLSFVFSFISTFSWLPQITEASKQLLSGTFLPNRVGKKWRLLVFYNKEEKQKCWDGGRYFTLHAHENSLWRCVFGPLTHKTTWSFYHLSALKISLLFK